MSRYTTPFKLAAVRQFLASSSSLSAMAKQCGVERGRFRRWVNLYQYHGVAGLEDKAPQYSPRRKVAILQHMWNNGLSYRQTAAMFNVRSPESLKQWEGRYRDGGIDALYPRRPSRRSKTMANPTPDKSPASLKDDQRSREELLAELEWLRMENAYLKKLKALVQAKEQAAAQTKRKP